MSDQKIHVIAPGALSLIQDAGRSGYQRYGVSVSGAADPEALRVANLLVGNSPGGAVIEVTFGGAVFSPTDDSIVAIAGADLQADLDGTPLPCWESFLAPAGSRLRFNGPRSGLRAYVAVAGGIATEPVLGSRATHVASRLGGLAGTPLQAGDELPVGEPETTSPGYRLPAHLRREYIKSFTVRVISGSQRSTFTERGIATFLESEYEVTERSDRQGLRLDGPVIEAVDGRYDIVSDAVPFGAIQVPGDGNPIVLLADRQTTGGYAKIGVVAGVDLPLLAQSGPGSRVRFKDIDVAEAQLLLRKRQSELMAANLEQDLRTCTYRMSLGTTSAQVQIAYHEQQTRTGEGRLVSVQIGQDSYLAMVRETLG